jgi:alginate production protein
MNRKQLPPLALLAACFTLDAQGADSESYFDSSAPPETVHSITEHLKFGARLELEYKQETDFNLDTEDHEDIQTLQPLASLAFSFAPSDAASLFLNLESRRRIVDDEEEKKQNETKHELKQAYLTLGGAQYEVEARLGRQRFNDRREWFYDDEMDALRLFVYNSDLMLEAAASRTNEKDFNLSDAEGQMTNYHLHAKYVASADEQIGLYYIVQEDRTQAVQEDRALFGLHAEGVLSENLGFWIEAGYLTGERADMDILGYGYDAGISYRFDASLKPSLTLAYAYGSGDDNLTDGKDGNFRQTGLQDNEAKLNGVTRIKYYGELLDPELSNLQVATAGFGFKPTRKSSIDLVYHYYRQNRTINRLRNAELEEKPDGLHKELGNEIDLIAGFRIKPHYKGEITLGYFLPGKAFEDDADSALYAEIEFDYQF